MKSPIYIKIPASQQGRTEEILNRLIQLSFAANLFFALFAGLFPFDFAVPPGGFFHALSLRWDWAWNPYDPGCVDRIENLLFLMPLGFFAAGFALSKQRRLRAGMLVLIATLTALVTSAIIECSQTLVSFRDPSFADLWCNTVGGAIGGVGFVVVGRKALRIVAQRLGRFERYFTVRNRVMLLIAYAVVQLIFPLTLHGSGELDVWDLGMPLLVGNELNATQRNWNGIVAYVALANRAATPEQVNSIYHAGAAKDVLGKDGVAEYVLTGPGPYPDLSGHEKPLVWAGPTPGTPTEQGVVTSRDSWLKTESNIFGAIRSIQQTSEFTFCTLAATLDPTQREIAPLRIATISSGTSARNVTFGQDIGDLVVRVRTAVAFMPDLYLHDVLSDTFPHALAVTAARGLIVVYVDGVERGRCEITPEAKMIWRLYPRGGFRLYIDRYGDRSYALMYRLIVMTPFALLLSVAVKRWNVTKQRKRLAILSAVAAMVVAMETVIWIQGGHAPSLINAVFSLVVGSTVLLATLPRRRHA